MANQIAIWLHTRRGDAVAIEKDAHIFHYEAGAPAILSSVSLRQIPGTQGIMNLSDLEKSFLPQDPHFAPTTLVCAEDTANRGGGQIYPIKTLQGLTTIAHKNKAAAHMDGARAFNAAVASGVPLSERVASFDSISVCFSKGLGAPVGSALCIPLNMRERAIRARKAMGGGMRQSGILAAAAIHALDHHIDRLSEDHENAQLLAVGLQEVGLEIEPCYTNMVYFHHPQASLLIEHLASRGIKALALTTTRIRMVTHLHVTREDVAHTIRSVSSLINSDGSLKQR
jgi:threonine aldolase